MKCVVQRVKSASVTVDGKVTGAIGLGLLVYLGVAQEDTDKELKFIAEKIPHLRIFPDAEDKMNRSLVDVAGEILLVSQFTLYGDCRKGRRPGFSEAAAPEKARLFYERLIELWRSRGLKTETGVFQSDMLVESVNWGPATFIVTTDS